MDKSSEEIRITGTGVLTPIGIGVSSFSEALRQGGTNFSTLSLNNGDTEFIYPVSLIDGFDFKEQVENINLESSLINKAKKLRNISYSATCGVYSALEAWQDSGLDKDLSLNSKKVAIVVAGSNTQQLSLSRVRDRYSEKLQFLNPSYGFNFLDTDLVGVLSSILDIKGEGYTVGAASASGNMGIIQGSRLIQNHDYDVVVVVAPVMELSVYEYQGFTALGAMAKVCKNLKPSEMYRPFDVGHSGFVYGQSAGCIILESSNHAAKRGAKSHGIIAGYGVSMDANRNPNPSKVGEQQAMKNAIEKAEIGVDQVDYVNTHGTGSIVGDKTEAEALFDLGLEGVKANSTKSLIGHGLSSAGTVEVIASLIQMKENFIHKSNNLVTPISDRVNWVKDTLYNFDIDYTMSNSFGFGGINTSIVLKK